MKTKAADAKRGPKVEPLGDVIEFMRLLWGLDHGLQSTSKRMGRELGITGPQRLVIRLVGRYPGISAGRLAEILHLHPSTLTGVLARLIDRGALVRDADPNDARRALFKLTAAGKKLDQSKAGTVESRVRRVLGRLPDSKVAAAREVLSALSRDLGVDTEPV
jgi:DNA-binding MarR family transcriptional regulator